MNDAAISSFVLEVYEPRLPKSSVNPCTLMRSVDIRLALRENYFSFVRTVNVFRPQNQLPAGLDASGRSEDVIKTIAFIKLRTFDRRIFFVAIKNHRAIVEQLRAIVTHPADNENTFDTRATPRKSIH